LPEPFEDNDGTGAAPAVVAGDAASIEPAPPATPSPIGEPATTAPVETASHRVGLLWRLVLALVAADQLTKAIVYATIPLSESRTVIPGFLDLTHVRNPGVAFGLLSDLDIPFKPVVTTALALVALLGIAYYARHVRPEERLARLGLSVILGGAIGNLIDRFRLSYVIDFVDVYWGEWHFWAFNVADASITIGALLVFYELLTNRHVSHSV
jgi:signal peptidase II